MLTAISDSDYQERIVGLIIADCPRCPANSITFDIVAGRYLGSEMGWKHHYELYCECRSCSKGSILHVAGTKYETQDRVDDVKKVVSIDHGLNSLVEVLGYLSLKDEISVDPPPYLPADVEAAFKEGATCFAVKCFNASAAMFRLAIDLATKGLLPKEGADTGGPNQRQRKQLHERLVYLFDAGRLSEDLRDLAICIKDDANDGAHDGSLSDADVEDIQDFATELFRRMFSEPERVRLAKLRRDQRDRPQA